MSAIAVTTPTAYTTLQRNAQGRASIAIVGTYTYASAGHIEASWNGGSYTRIASISAGTSAAFSGSLANQPGGQGTLTVRIEEEPATSATVVYVGVGDVIGLGGQSNMSGAATNPQVYSHPTLKATNFHNGAWEELVDPYRDSGGSIAPLLATRVMAVTNLPVGVIGMSAGGKPIALFQKTSDWHLYDSLFVEQIAAAGPVNVILWWQGESDVELATTGSAYEAYLRQLAADIHADFGVKLMPAKLQSISDYNDADEAAIRNAVGAVWADSPDVYQGPDLSVIASGVHLITDEQMAQAADLWYAAYEAAGLTEVGGASRFASPFAGVVR